MENVFSPSHNDWQAWDAVSLLVKFSRLCWAPFTSCNNGSNLSNCQAVIKLLASTCADHIQASLLTGMSSMLIGIRASGGFSDDRPDRLGNAESGLTGVIKSICLALLDRIMMAWERPQPHFEAAESGQKRHLPAEIIKLIFLHLREDLEANGGDWRTPLRRCMRANKQIQQAALEAFFVKLDFNPRLKYTWRSNRALLHRAACNPLFAARVRTIDLSLVCLFDHQCFKSLDLTHLSRELKSLADDLRKLVCLRRVHIDVSLAWSLHCRQQRVHFWRFVLAALPGKALHLYIRGDINTILDILSKVSVIGRANNDDETKQGNIMMGDAVATPLQDFFGRLRTLDISVTPARTIVNSIVTIDLGGWLNMPKVESLSLACPILQFGHPMVLKMRPNSFKSLHQLCLERSSVSTVELVDLLKFNQPHFTKIALVRLHLRDGSCAEVFEQLVACPELYGVFIRDLSYNMDWISHPFCVPRRAAIAMQGDYNEYRALATRSPQDIAALASLIRYQHGRNGHYWSHRHSPVWSITNNLRWTNGQVRNVWDQIVPSPHIFDNLITAEDVERRRKNAKTGLQPVQRGLGALQNARGTNSDAEYIF